MIKSSELEGCRHHHTVVVWMRFSAGDSTPALHGLVKVNALLEGYFSSPAKISETPCRFVSCVSHSAGALRKIHQNNSIYILTHGCLSLRSCKIIIIAVRSSQTKMLALRKKGHNSITFFMTLVNYSQYNILNTAAV